MNDMKTHSLAAKHRTYRVVDKHGNFLCYKFAKDSTNAVALAKWDFPTAVNAY